MEFQRQNLVSFLELEYFWGVRLFCPPDLLRREGRRGEGKGENIYIFLFYYKIIFYIWWFRCQGSIRKWIDFCPYIFLFFPYMSKPGTVLLLESETHTHTHTHIYIHIYLLIYSFPGGSASKESACSAGDPGSIPGLGRSPGEGNVNPLQYSCLENYRDRGAWQAIVHGVAKSQTWLSD